MPSGLRGRSDRDFDTLAEGVKESEEAVESVAFDAAADERGHFRLIDPEKLGGIGLRQVSLGDQGADVLDKFRFGEGEVGIGKTEVGKDVSAAAVDGTGLLSWGLALSVFAV